MDHEFGVFGKIVNGYEDCAGSKVLAELERQLLDFVVSKGYCFV